MLDDGAFDVVVVGAGLAGHVSALTAFEAGASVCLLEKGPQFGGSSILAGGLVFAGTDVQRAQGVHDTSAALREALLAAGKGKARPEVVDAYVDNQLETYEWLQTKGIKTFLAPPFPPGDTPRAHMTGKGGITSDLHSALRATAVAYQGSAEVVRLLRNPEGRVDAVQVVIDGAERVIAANEGVVLASGGFARSKDLIETFAPQWSAAVKMSGRHNSGDGIRIARALGADLDDMAYVAGSFGASIERYPDLSEDPDEETILLYANKDGAIIVNVEGNRFCDETLGYKALGIACSQQTNAIAFQIFDQAVMDTTDPRETTMNYQGAYERGLVKGAETLADLAEVLQIDSAALERTVKAYNSAIDAQVDAAFGRPVDRGPESGIRRIERAPFYGYPTRNGMTSTYAGLRVDGRMRVIDVFGDPIPGLYAAGEVVGGLHGSGYYAGSALGKAAVFGRIAGREASIR